MEVYLTSELSSGSAQNSDVILEVSQIIREYFSGLDFGKDVKEVAIGVICVAPDFEFFTKPRKPKYVRLRRHVRDGREMVLDKVFMFDIKLDYERFSRGSKSECRTLLSQAILDSLNSFQYLPKSVKDFDVEAFTQTMRFCLKNERLT